MAVVNVGGVCVPKQCVNWKEIQQLEVINELINPIITLVHLKVKGY